MAPWTSFNQKNVGTEVFREAAGNDATPWPCTDDYVVILLAGGEVNVVGE